MYVFLTKGQVDDLKKKGLELSMESFERDDSEKGFIVSKDDLSVFLDAEEIAYEMKEKVFEGIENIKFGTISAGAPKLVKTKSVSMSKTAGSVAAPTHIDVDAPEATWDGKGRDKFVEVAKDELKGVFGKVHISVPNGEVEAPNDAEYELNIRIWSSPNEKAIRGDGKELRPPEKLFGETVVESCRDPAFAPSKKNTVVFKDGDFAWGEYIKPNYLFILFDVCQKDTAACLAIFRAMLQQFVKEVGKDALRESTKEISKKREEKQRDELRTFMKNMLSAQFASSKQRVETLTRDIDQMHGKLVGLIRDRDFNMKLFKCFDEAEVDKKIAVMVRDLYQDKNIIGLKIEGNSFKVFTDTLYVEDSRTKWKHELGKFRIELDCTTANIKIFNLTRQIVAYSGQKMNAPHVFQNNTLCQGNFIETSAELFAKHDYSNLASTLIIFLQSANTDDAAGRWVHRWPKVNADGTITEYEKLSKEDRDFLVKKGIQDN